MDDHKSMQVLEKVLLATIKEQRAKRRWGIFFKLTFLGFFLFIILYVISSGGGPASHAVEHTAVIKIQDEIGSTTPANAESINEALQTAFENAEVKGIILELNSPGGSPVQAGEIYDEIIRLKKLYPSKSVYGVVTDLCASGCYYIAAAADAIYANEASLVGSIGVLFDGFGFVGTLDKVGAQRRLITAGKNKAFLDPFVPLTPEHEAFMHDLLAVVHTQFIDKVKSGRGDRLKIDDQTFSGLVWTGQQAVGFGLIDGIASVRKVATEVVGRPVMIDYTEDQGMFSHFKKIGVSMKHILFESNDGYAIKLK